MPISEFIAMVQLMIAGQITPGPNNALLSSSGMRFGYRATMPHALGIMFGHSLMEFLVALGLGNAYRAFPIIETILYVIAITLITYLAFKVATAPVENFSEAKNHAKPWGFWHAFWFQYINPKAWLIAIGISAAYASAERPLLTASLIGITTLFTAIISTQTWTLFGVAMKRILDTPLKRRIFNVVMAALMLWSVVILLKGN